MTPETVLTTTVPRVMCDEDGEIYYAEGHIDRWRFVLAVMVQLYADCGLDPIEPYFDDDERLRDVAAEVRWTWHRERFPGDELMPECSAADAGAVPFTQVRL